MDQSAHAREMTRVLYTMSVLETSRTVVEAMNVIQIWREIIRLYGNKQFTTVPLSSFGRSIEGDYQDGLCFFGYLDCEEGKNPLLFPRYRATLPGKVFFGENCPALRESIGVDPAVLLRVAKLLERVEDCIHADLRDREEQEGKVG